MELPSLARWALGLGYHRTRASLVLLLNLPLRLSCLRVCGMPLNPILMIKFLPLGWLRSLSKPWMSLYRAYRTLELEGKLVSATLWTRIRS